MSYVPGAAPETLEALIQFINEEYEKIAAAIRLFGTEGAWFVPHETSIDKPRYGLVAYSAAGVLGTNEGLYRYSSGGSWVYIG